MSLKQREKMERKSKIEARIKLNHNTYIVCTSLHIYNARNTLSHENHVICFSVTVEKHASLKSTHLVLFVCLITFVSQSDDDDDDDNDHEYYYTQMHLFFPYYDCK